jgi:hypothetical protein
VDRLTLAALSLVGIIAVSPAIASDTAAAGNAPPSANSMAPTGSGMMAAHAGTSHKGQKAHPTKTGMATTHAMAPTGSMAPANSMAGTH